MQTLERRFMSATQVRAIVSTHFSSSPGTLTGYSATYNRLSSDLGGFVERVASTAFDKSLRNGDDARCNFNHDNSRILGRVANGTLRLRSDTIGLHNECDLPDTSYARDLLTSVQRRDVTDQSFGFTVDDEDWDEMEDPDDPYNRSARIKVRTLRSVRLIDTAFVVDPAYPGTSVSAPGVNGRSFEQLFPDGIPVEVRSRCGAEFRARFEARSTRRLRLRNLILSI